MTKPFYDVFVSHAYQDQNKFANALALALKKQGLKVWYSGFELVPGTSISSTVNQALHESKYGVIIVTPVYLTLPWAMKELKTFFAQKTNQKRVLLVLHQISVSKFGSQLPMLTDRHVLASRTSVSTVVKRVLQVIKEKKPSEKKSVNAPAKTKSLQGKKKSESVGVHNAGVIVLGGKADPENADDGNITIRNSKK